MSAHIHQLTETIRLPHWQRFAIYGVTVWLFASGVTWLIARYTLRTAGEFGETVHPLEPWMLRVHGIAVLLGLFMYGTLLRAHMLKAWHLRKNRISGALASLVMIMLMASGYLLYYAGDEMVRPIISLVHWSIGLGLGAMLPLHIWLGRRRPKAVSRKPRADTAEQSRAQRKLSAG